MRKGTRGTKDPKGGLTAEGRAYFRRAEGAHLKPGVKGRVDTPEKMRRKGSYLRRFFARKDMPPLIDDHGKPTRLALSARAWGEPVPRTEAQARRLAKKGDRLLERYRKAERPPRATNAGKRGKTATARRSRRG